ncbi:MAG TPA: hypothetical protein VMZ53_26295 [Kofleriaceae bacterium]|nr:hypothetical protein [Kofleriaceae bacterium]
MDSSQLLLERLTLLRDSWPNPPWTWDSRFQTVAASFSKEMEPDARKSAMNAFPRGWTTKSLENAPPDMQAIAERTGGLRSGQRLLAGDEMFAPKLFALWWPWGGGDTITLRIGVDGATPELIAAIRDLFGAH